MMEITCPECESTNVVKCGKPKFSRRRIRQNRQCNDCGRKFLGEFIAGVVQS